MVLSSASSVVSELVTLFQCWLSPDHRGAGAGGGHRQVRGGRSYDTSLLDRDAVPQDLQQGAQKSGKGYPGEPGSSSREHVNVSHQQSH